MAGPADSVVQSRREPKETFTGRGVVMGPAGYSIGPDVFDRAIPDTAR